MTTLTSRIERWGSLESLAARSFLNSELESKALAEVTKKLRDAMMPKMTMTALESLQSTTRFLLASGLTGGRFCISANCLGRWAAMCRRRGNAR